jgi:uncharacterized delta-60 repeat protein
MFTPFAFIQPITTVTPITPELQNFVLFGVFRSYNTTYYGGILKINSSGSVDQTFNMGAGFNANIYDAIIQSDGKILAGGQFTTYSGSSITGLVRINPNGTRDTTFNIGTGANLYASRILQQSDGKIIAVGSFTTISGSTSRGIVRLNTSGSIDTTFNVGSGITGSNFYAIDQQSDGKIIVGGWITGYSGSVVNGLMRLNTNGTRDTTFNVGTGFTTFVVNDLKLQSDGKIIVVGGFTTYSGSTNNYIVRINTDGTKDTTFNIGTGFNSQIYNGVTIQPDGKILIGANSNVVYSGSTSNSPLIRINTNGTRDLTFTSGMQVGSSFQPSRPRALSSDGGIYTVYSSGNAITGSGATAIVTNYIAKLNPTGGLDTSFDIGYSNSTSSRGFTGPNQTPTGIIASGSGEAVFVFGSSPLIYKNRGYGALVATNIQGSATGSTALTFNNNVQGTLANGGGFPSGIVYKVRKESNGYINVVGSFTTIGNNTATRIARLTPTGIFDTNLRFGTGANNLVSDIAINQSTNERFLVGNFTTYSGSTVNRIVKTIGTGQIDTTFNVGTGFSGNPTNAILQPDGKLVVISFAGTYSASLNVGTICRINTNGTLDTVFSASIRTGFNSTPSTIAVQPDGKIIFGGNFTSFNSTGSVRLCRLNSDGTRDSTFNVGTGLTAQPSALYVQSDGKIMVLGSFTQYSGSSIVGMARINSSGSLDTTFNPGTGVSSPFNATGQNVIEQDSSGNYYVGGLFSTFNGASVNNFTILTPSGSFLSTYNSGSVSFNGASSIGLNALVSGIALL